MPSSRIGLLPAALALVLAMAGCGSSSNKSATSQSSATATSTPRPSSPAPDLTAAEHPRPSVFPRPGGRTLQQLAAGLHGSAQFGAATGTFTPGVRRVAFALNTSGGAFIYAPTVVYVASTANSHDVKGPFPAPADPVTVAPPYRSKQNSGPGGIQAIYAASIPLAHAGTFAVLTLSQTPSGGR